MAKRGMELPVNTLIVVSVAVIVLLVVVGMFSGTISLMPFKDEAKLNAACMKWQRTTCDSTTYTQLQVEGESIKSICETYFEGITDTNDVRQKCAEKCCPMGGNIVSACSKCPAGETRNVQYKDSTGNTKTTTVDALLTGDIWYCVKDIAGNQQTVIERDSQTNCETACK